MPKITLGELKTFTAIHKAGSFRATALALDVSQCAISQSIQRLESKLKKRLILRRDGRSASRLSLAGHASLAAAADILEACELYGIKQLDHLEGLVAIVEAGNKQAAGRRLYMTGDNLGHKIKLLQRDTGKQLFAKGTSRLTQDGRALYRVALRVLDLCATIEGTNHPAAA